MDLLLAGSIFAITLAIALTLARRGASEADRVPEVLKRWTVGEAPAAEEVIRSPRPSLEGRPLAWAFSRLNLLAPLEDSMLQAGIYMPAADMAIIVVLLGLSGVAGGLWFFADPTLAAGCGGGLVMLPLVYIRFKRKRRLKAFGAQLPYALDLIKSSLEAGHSLLRGLQVVVKEFADPLGGEFRIAVEQTRLGMPLGQALEELLRRVPEDDLRLFTVAVKVQAEVGSSLAQIVGRLTEIVRMRQRLHAQIRALTAQSRMSGMVVGLLPAFVLAAFSLIQPGYTEMLFSDPTGIKILKVAITLDVVAFLTIRRIVRVEY